MFVVIFHFPLHKIKSGVLGVIHFRLVGVCLLRVFVNITLEFDGSRAWVGIMKGWS